MESQEHTATVDQEAATAESTDEARTVPQDDPTVARPHLLTLMYRPETPAKLTDKFPPAPLLKRDAGTFVMGRGQNLDVLLNDEHMPRRFVELWCRVEENGLPKWLVKNLSDKKAVRLELGGSRTTVRFNEVKELQDGQKLKLEMLVFTVRIEEGDLVESTEFALEFRVLEDGSTSSSGSFHRQTSSSTDSSGSFTSASELARQVYVSNGPVNQFGHVLPVGVPAHALGPVHPPGQFHSHGGLVYPLGGQVPIPGTAVQPGGCALVYYPTTCAASLPVPGSHMSAVNSHPPLHPPCGHPDFYQHYQSPQVCYQAGRSAVPPGSYQQPAYASHASASPRALPGVGGSHASSGPGPYPAVGGSHASSGPGPYPGIVGSHATTGPGSYPGVGGNSTSTNPGPHPGVRGQAGPSPNAWRGSHTSADPGPHPGVGGQAGPSPNAWRGSHTSADPGPHPGVGSQAGPSPNAWRGSHTSAGPAPTLGPDSVFFSSSGAGSGPPVAGHVPPARTSIAPAESGPHSQQPLGLPTVPEASGMRQQAAVAAVQNSARHAETTPPGPNQHFPHSQQSASPLQQFPSNGSTTRVKEPATATCPVSQAVTEDPSAEQSLSYQYPTLYTLEHQSRPWRGAEECRSGQLQLPNALHGPLSMPPHPNTGTSLYQPGAAPRVDAAQAVVRAPAVTAQPESAAGHVITAQQPQSAVLHSVQQPQSTMMHNLSGQQPQSTMMHNLSGQQPESAMMHSSSGQQPQSAVMHNLSGQQPESAMMHNLSGQQPQSAMMHNLSGQQPESAMMHNLSGQQPESAMMHSSSGQQPQSAMMHSSSGQQPQSAMMHSSSGQQPQSAMMHNLSGQQPESAMMHSSSGQQPQSAMMHSSSGQQPQSAMMHSSSGQQPQSAMMHSSSGQQPQSAAWHMNRQQPQSAACHMSGQQRATLGHGATDSSVSRAPSMAGMSAPAFYSPTGGLPVAPPVTQLSGLALGTPVEVTTPFPTEVVSATPANSLVHTTAEGSADGVYNLSGATRGTGVPNSYSGVAGTGGVTYSQQQSRAMPFAGNPSSAQGHLEMSDIVPSSSRLFPPSSNPVQTYSAPQLQPGMNLGEVPVVGGAPAAALSSLTDAASNGNRINLRSHDGIAASNPPSSDFASEGSFRVQDLQRAGQGSLGPGRQPQENDERQPQEHEEQD